MTLQAVQDIQKADKIITDLQDPVTQLTKRVEQLEANEGVEPITPYYPSRATMWQDESIVVTGGAFAKVFSAVQSYGIRVYQGSFANGDSFSNGFLLKAGTYTLVVLGESRNDNGLIDWYIDNVKVVSLQDWYSAGLTQNVEKTASVAVVDDGYHVLKGVINGKNASSSGHTLILTKLHLKPATDTEDHA